MKLRLGHLYPELMNIYADRGNVECLSRRAQWRGLDVEVVPLGAGAAESFHDLDIILMGGGQDRQQEAASRDLAGAMGARLKDAVAEGTPLLAVCGGYQLMGHRYVAADGAVLEGLGIFDLETKHPGPRSKRCIGDIAVRWEGATIVGFENHGGRTYLGAGTEPLGRVLSGHGNNSEDGAEGARTGTAFGTYLHGSLLPKNPHFADRLLEMALRRREPGFRLDPLDDREEWAAHSAALRKIGLRKG